MVCMMIDQKKFGVDLLGRELDFASKIILDRTNRRYFRNNATGCYINGSRGLELTIYTPEHER